MDNYRWTRRVAAAGFGILTLWIVFVVMVRIVNLPLAGVQPEAFALIAMMTAPFTLGVPVVVTLAVASLETVRRWRGSAPAG